MAHMGDPAPITGWIYVLDDGLVGKSWKKKWAILQSIPSRLEYMKSADDKPQNFFALDHDSKVSKETTLDYPKKSGIWPLQLRTPFGPNLVGFESDADREKWLKAISARIMAEVEADKHIRDESAFLEATFTPPTTQPKELLDLESTSMVAFPPLIFLSVMEAADLPKMDTIGSCDAYCRIHMRPYRKVRSSVVQNKLNPLWNEDFTFIVEPHEKAIRIEVWDADSTGDDEFVGQVQIELASLVSGELVDRWFDLTQRTFKDPSKPGRIHLRLQRSTSENGGFLHQYGIPSGNIPRRVDTGDLLLFNNQSVLSAGLRAITRSKFDHVALVVRKWDNNLSILESTADGVCLYKYEGRLANRTGYTVGIRRLLRVERNGQMRKTVWDFVTSVRGKPYEAQTLQMINSAFKMNSKEDLSTIFCSELVAAAYHRLGILDQKIHTANNYLPADFAPAGSAHLPFLLGATLEPKVVSFLALKKLNKKAAKAGVPQEQRMSTVTLGYGGAVPHAT